MVKSSWWNVTYKCFKGNLWVCEQQNKFRRELSHNGATWEHSWFSSTVKKVVDLIPSEVTEFFNLPNNSSCTIALGLTQPPTEMSTIKSFWGDKTQPVCKVDNLTAICVANV
jgi:hypothetical protein